ncbi:sulfite reductase [Ginsengibacter hankyongi]|uniref:assimilatory sulfite reductase (NADPH) n=1 Tax=Ginsengibacter hankyongi TaxID=2607284 RepID=A0A5J5IEG8_9BACT|nr:flavodoxin domain-containing protein [Ginsengibacter hankyongi]KAA9038106.1 sulfite reductase [Ginsengibacter hankyongi]
MLAENKLKTLRHLIDESTSDELIWINGYLNGIVSTKSSDEKIAVKTNPGKITIAYGTETGNSKKLATEFAVKAKKKGIQAKVQSLDQYRLNDLTKEDYFLAVISTHGDGEPPAAAKKFYDHVHNNGFKLDKLKYSVLALGDTSYPLFCKAGEDVDEQLNKLGGRRIAPLQKCDIDFDTEAEQWFNEICKALNDNTSLPSIVAPNTVTKKSSGKKIYNGKLLAHINLNDRESNKETYHIEIEAEDVVYQPGDSIGIIPENKKALIEEIIALTKIDDTTNIDYKGELISLYNLLHKKLNITYLPERVVKQYAGVIQKDIQIERCDLSELLKKYPVKDADQFTEVVKILEPIAPRLYSIASSPEAHAGEIHITVAKNSFKVNDTIEYGLASEFLSHFNTDNELQFYIHPNNRFRLPDEDKNIIMIGPGTGIAPFRSFIAERDAKGATGKNWLFFGEQHFVTDFLYQSEIQNWFETGTLTKVSTAFSRDQKEKIYVQHKMMQHGNEFFEWLHTGAYVYVCGTKDPMSIDVEETIIAIIEKFGERSNTDAVKYLDDLKEEGKYVTDVY